jgi:hypothetical protein
MATELQKSLNRGFRRLTRIGETEIETCTPRAHRDELECGFTESITPGVVNRRARPASRGL